MEHLLSNGFEDLLLSKMFPETQVTRRGGKQIICRGLLLVMWKRSYISSLAFRNSSSPSTVQVLKLCNLIRVASRRKCDGKNAHLLMLSCVLSLGLACFWKFYTCLWESWDLCPALQENCHRRQTSFFNPRTTGDVLAEGIPLPV